MKKSKIIISLILNCLIFLAVLTGIVMIFTAPHQSADGLVSETPVSAFRFFTTDSNVLMLFASAIFIIYDSLTLIGKTAEIPVWAYIVKLTGTVGVAVTLVTVLCFLAPLAPGGFLSMFIGRDLFFHLIVPLLSVVTYVFFEGTRKIKFRYTFFGLAPVLIYGVAYAANAFSHSVDGIVPVEHDWYGFAQGGILQAIVAFAIMITVAFIISVLLRTLNRRFAVKI